MINLDNLVCKGQLNAEDSEILKDAIRENHNIVVVGITTDSHDIICALKNEKGGSSDDKVLLEVPSTTYDSLADVILEYTAGPRKANYKKRTVFVYVTPEKIEVGIYEKADAMISTTPEMERGM